MSSQSDQYVLANHSLRGKTILVTGASRGIGAGIAYELGLRGADVVLSYTSPSSKAKAEAVAASIAAGGGGRTLIVQADMTDLSALAKLADAACDFGNGGLDILVNNAGATQDMPCKATDLAAYQNMFDVNVRGPTILTGHLVDRLRRGGRVINISSVAARTALPNQGPYCATKAAIEALTRCWAAEFGREKGVTVNAVNPGPVSSDMWSSVNEKTRTRMEAAGAPSGDRIGEPADIAKIVGFLCESGSGWVNSSVINANGGITPV